MGMYDSVMVNCPKCGEESEFQSKSGDCMLEVYNLNNCPEDVLRNVNRHSPNKCECGVFFGVDVKNRKAFEVIPYCQREIEGETACEEECDHCKEYYKPLKEQE